MGSSVQIINKIHRTSLNSGSERYFRGHSNFEHPLIPSIYRNGLIENEHIIFRESILHVPEEFSGYQKTIEFLSKMQHYQIPTRLLDITTNPMVALYFACCNNPETDGELIGIDVPNDHIKYFDSDTVSVISNLSKMDSNFKSPDQKKVPLESFNDKYYPYLLHEIRQEKPYFQNIINPNHVSSIYAVKAKLNNLRMQKQDAAFLLFGVDQIKNKPSTISADWLVYKGDRRLVIKAKNKQKILNNLEKIGISKRSLFPEIANLGEFLKNKYRK